MKDTRKRFLELADSLEPSIARAFVQAILDLLALQSPSQMRLLEAAIASGNADQVFLILQIRNETFSALDEQMRSVFIAGAAYKFDSVPKKTTDQTTGAQLIVRYDGTQPRAADIVRRLGADKITGLVEEARETIRETIAEGVEESRPPKSLALDLAGRMNRATGRREGGLIGLSGPQASTVRSVRQAMLTGDRKRMQAYLRLKGRDKRYDGFVRRALKAGEPVAAKDVRTITGRMADIYLRKRGEAIARSETIPALNAGRREATQQMIDRGIVRPWQVQRGWDATGDARTRFDHLLMEGQTVEWGQAFTFPDGSQAMGPGDTSLGAPAKQTINCRCYEKMDVSWLSMVN